MIQGLLILIALFLFIAFIWGVKSVVAALASAVGGDAPAARPQQSARANSPHAGRREALDALKEAHALFERGVLTREELDQLKRELLA